MELNIEKVIIYNPVNYHYECIESVIHYMHLIFGVPAELLSCRSGSNIQGPELILNIVPESGFTKYIETYKSKLQARYNLSEITIIDSRQEVILPSSEKETRITLTIPDNNKLNPNDYIISDPTQIQSNNKIYQNYYIIHNADLINQPFANNVFYLAPYFGRQYFIPDILPFSPKSVSYQDSPAKSGRLTFLIQGNVNRRSKNLIGAILDFFKMNNEKIISHSVNLLILTKSRSINVQKSPNIKMIIGSNFWDFHYYASQANIILPLISKSSHPQYYTNKLTSSISYGLAYGMDFLIDKELAALYNLSDEKTIHTYTNNSEFIKIFKTLIKNS